METEASRIEPHRVERLFEALLTRDGAGGSWLSALLQAAPRGPQQLGELVSAPGWLEVMIAVRTETGRRGAFEYPAAPTRRLLGWFIDHPDALRRPVDETASAETVRLRHALLDDDPPGARGRAQDRARDLLRRSTSASRAWWRFEEVHAADCVLMTDRLLLLVTGGDADAPATPWFPDRTALVRDLEAAQRFADGGKAWGVLRLTDAQINSDAGRGDRVAVALRVGAPHLDDGERAQLADGDLGELSYAQAAAATDVELFAPGAARG
jgi:hypothetical protein